MTRSDIERQREWLVATYRSTGDERFLEMLRESYSKLFRSVAVRHTAGILDDQQYVISLIISECNFAMLRWVHRWDPETDGRFTTSMMSNILRRIRHDVLFNDRCCDGRRGMRFATSVWPYAERPDVMAFVDVEIIPEIADGVDVETDTVDAMNVAAVIRGVEESIDLVKEIGHIDAAWKVAARGVLHNMISDRPLGYKELAEMISTDERKFGKTTVWLMVRRIREIVSNLVCSVPS